MEYIGVEFTYILNSQSYSINCQDPDQKASENSKYYYLLGVQEFNGYDDKNLFFKANHVHDNAHIDALSAHGYLLKVS